VSESVAVQNHGGEARADSRQLAARMGNKHHGILSLIEDYEEDFRTFGALSVELEVRAGQQKSGGGLPSRYVMLNEEQCYFLLTLVRNSDTTVPMKRELVLAFSRYRQQLAAPVLPTDPIELLELSLQGIRQTRQEVQALRVTTAAIEARLDNTPISMFPEQEAVIYSLCQELGGVMPGGWRAAYRAFKSQFGHAGVPIAKYTSLPTSRFEEACGWLRGLIAEHSRGRLLGRGA